LCWRPWPYCTRVITNLTLSLLPPLRQHHCLCCVGAFAPVALALLPLSPLHCRQHSKLASAQSQNSCNMHWCHCQHRAIGVAGVAPALFPLLRRCLCPCCAGVATLSAPALPPASQTGICPVMTQSQHVLGEASLSCLTSLPVALLLYPASAHSNYGLWQSGKGSDCIFFFGVALVSSLALRWRHCQHQAFLVASVAPAMLPSWPSKVRPMPRWRLPELCLRFARIPLASLPALCCCPCCRHCAGIIALVTWALLPLLRWHLCPFLGQQKIGSASALSGFSLKFVKQCRQHRQPLIITPPPTDAMGDSSLFFVLAFLGRRKIGSASALSGFPLKIFLHSRNQTTPATLDDRNGSPHGRHGR
jgi:hypothetical protein